jgi:hypothetical protein
MACIFIDWCQVYPACVVKLQVEAFPASGFYLPAGRFSAMSRGRRQQKQNKGNNKILEGVPVPILYRDCTPYTPAEGNGE